MKIEKWGNTKDKINYLSLQNKNICFFFADIFGENFVFHLKIHDTKINIAGVNLCIINSFTMAITQSIVSSAKCSYTHNLFIEAEFEP